MIGRRYDLTEWAWTEEDAPKLWDYGTQANGHWYCVTPSGTASLDAHQVIEHEDRTISVSPSILVGLPGLPQGSWHGFLERGAYRVA